MTDFYLCECGTEAISISDWSDGDETIVGISMWRIGGVRYSLRAKLALIWDIIRCGHPWTDDILLDGIQARELAGNIMKIVDGGWVMIDESPRQRVYDAIDRECERLGLNGRNDDINWENIMWFAGGVIKHASGGVHDRHTRQKMVKVTAYLVACLEQYMERECDQQCKHEWWVRDHFIGMPRRLSVKCAKCMVRGVVGDLSVHEWEEAWEVPNPYRWYDPDRVIVEGEDHDY